MRSIRQFILPAVVAAAVSAVSAQPASGPGPGPGPGAGPGPGSGASAPRGGPGHKGGRWGNRYTPGWSMMTQQEQAEHRAKMQSMTNHDECKAYMEQHHQQMVARAKEKGLQMPKQPRRDACGGLKP